MTIRETLVLAVALCALSAPSAALGQATLAPDEVTIQKAKVIEVSDQKTEEVTGTGTASQTETLRVQILSGENAGSEITFKNDYIQLSVGDVFFLRHQMSDLDGTDYYTVSDPYRLNVLAIAAIVFVLLIVVFGGLQGIRGFLSLCGSVLLIFYVLIPGILGGYSPVLVSIGVASIIIVVGSYITHGINRTTTAAVLGMIGTVLVTGLAAYYVVHAAHLSGLTTEENVYLNFNTHGQIDMLGLLYGGIMIGLLGVLYDIAIGQSIAVEELLRAGAHLTRLQIYSRAIRIGREHIGALVNTLAIAYVGAALPLLLLVQTSTYGILYAINNELFATEIIRILIGSAGLILGVPITTLIASYMLFGREFKSHPDGHSGHAHHH